MPTPTKGARLGGSPAHQRAILSNLATNLFQHGSITTTEAKARRLRPLAEKLISKAKRGDLHNRRQVLSVVRDKGVVHALFTEIGPRYADRPGGYTRITKLGPRKGDNAPMAVISLVEGEFTATTRTTRQPASGATGRRRAAEPAAAQPAAPKTTDTELTDAEPVVAESADTESIGTESADTESVGAESADTESTDAESADAESADAAPVDDEPTGAGATAASDAAE